MNSDVQGALAAINTSYKAFEHKGKRMTQEQVKSVLQYAVSKGYKTTDELSDAEVDSVLAMQNV